jgi:hypothetical protein
MVMRAGRVELVGDLARQVVGVFAGVAKRVGLADDFADAVEGLRPPEAAAVLDADELTRVVIFAVQRVTLKQRMSRPPR